MPEITKAIHDRVKARLALQRQLCVLEKAKVLAVDLALPEKARSMFPEAQPTSRIRNWTTVNWEDYTQVGITEFGSSYRIRKPFTFVLYSVSNVKSSEILSEKSNFMPSFIMIIYLRRYNCSDRKYK